MTGIVLLALMEVGCAGSGLVPSLGGPIAAGHSGSVVVGILFGLAGCAPGGRVHEHRVTEGRRGAAGRAGMSV
jgi:hypothetical protein